MQYLYKHNKSYLGTVLCLLIASMAGCHATENATYEGTDTQNRSLKSSIEPIDGVATPNLPDQHNAAPENVERAVVTEKTPTDLDGMAKGKSIITGQSGSLTWDLWGDREAVKVVDLTIQGGEMVMTQTFKNGEAITLDKTLPDGKYIWRAVATPEIDPTVMSELRDLRLLGDIQKEEARIKELRKEGIFPTQEETFKNVKSGHFMLQNSHLVSNQTEAR